MANNRISLTVGDLFVTWLTLRKLKFDVPAKEVLATLALMDNDQDYSSYPRKSIVAAIDIKISRATFALKMHTRDLNLINKSWNPLDRKFNLKAIQKDVNNAKQEVERLQSLRTTQ